MADESVTSACGSRSCRAYYIDKDRSQGKLLRRGALCAYTWWTQSANRFAEDNRDRGGPRILRVSPGDGRATRGFRARDAQSANFRHARACKAADRAGDFHGLAKIQSRRVSNDNRPNEPAAARGERISD